jgi:hypothetical protein
LYVQVLNGWVHAGQIMEGFGEGFGYPRLCCTSNPVESSPKMSTRGFPFARRCSNLEASHGLEIVDPCYYGRIRQGRVKGCVQGPCGWCKRKNSRLKLENTVIRVEI